MPEPTTEGAYSGPTIPTNKQAKGQAKASKERPGNSFVDHRSNTDN